jgi:colanic acid/amylovoran biosynthesis glycosyltransferase
MKSEIRNPKPELLLYLSSQLPKRSETFVYRELLGLRAAGVTVLAASLHAPERDLGEPRLEALANEAIPVYGAGLVRLLLDFFLELLRHPWRTTGTLLLAARDALTADDLHARLARLKVPGQALAALALARHLRGRGITHIHAHFAHAPATVAMYAARQLGLPFSFTGHAVDLFRDRALLKVKLQRARFVNCISEWHRTFYQDLVPRPDADYPVVRCGVDLAEFAPSGRAPGDPPVLLGVGRLVAKKGFDVLLEAAARLRARGQSFTIRIAGDGPEGERLAAQCTRLGLGDGVHFLGACANPLVRKLLQETDVFVLPCQIDREGDRDGIPVVLMEAMAAGVPVVSGDLPALRELVIPGRTGELVPPGDVEALAERLAVLLQAPDLRAKRATAGRQWVAEEFALDVNIQRIVNMLQKKT